MKLLLKITITIIIASSLMISSSCKKKHDDLFIDEKSPILYPDFEYQTVFEYDLTIEVLNNQNAPIDGVYLELYLFNPLNNDGSLNKTLTKKIIFKGITWNGNLKCKIKPPTAQQDLYVLTYHIGVPNLTKVKLNDEKINIRIGGVLENRRTINSNKSIGSVPIIINGYYTLGNWNNSGVPNYLEPVNDQISNDFLADVNASLPEHQELPVSHPQYLIDNNDASLELKVDAEVWVTLVHEGAGWHNSLGYYTYTAGNPPFNANAIIDKTLIFPDVTIGFNNLQSGNKVQLLYLDPVTNVYMSVFPAGTCIGWFLVAQGWSGGSQMVVDNYATHYSNPTLNVESDPLLQKHNVLLYDSERDVLLLGFEDIRRDASGCDQDFNDAVFYTTVSPFLAVDNTKYQPIDTPQDSDNDGTSDLFDEYPNDPELSFNNYYPSENSFGTLVYEDLWPSKGDYDFNDLVLDYNFNQITNSQNEVVKINVKTVVRAIGASYHNSFGISLNTSPSNIASVTGQRLGNGLFNVLSNGTEAGQSKAVVLFFDDAFNALPYPGNGVSVNTYPQNQYVSPDTMLINIDLITAESFSNIGTPPYNPFIVINQNRGVEVHLPNMAPTDLVSTELFGTGDDNSNLGINKYYVSDIHLPWAINLPESFNYPAEKENITKTYLQFNNWATSMGYNYKDWYSDKSGYRDHGRVYYH